VIKLALENSDKIKEIYKRISGSVKEGNWLPVQMICEKCGKVSTTLATAFDGEKVTYTCRNLDWTNGCGYTGSNTPFNGAAKLPWKIEWAAKFRILNVDVEGGGKDHSTKGGSRDVAEAIAREVFAWQPPVNVPYEFFLVGGKKMSSSKGRGSFSGEMAELLPPEILRLLLLQKEPQRVIEFIPDGDTVPILFDAYDKFATAFYAGDTTDYSRMFSLIHPQDMRGGLALHTMPRFSQIAFLSQMSHLNIEKEVEHILEKELSEGDKKELDKRLSYAKIWIDTYAPEDYKFEIKESIPEIAKNLSEIQKKALAEILTYTKNASVLDGQAFHTELHELKTRINIEPRELFEAIYLSILGKTSGPKAGWFLSVMDKEFLIKRLTEVIAS
jgi:lysyl-tRNA synthetase class 1